MRAYTSKLPVYISLGAMFLEFKIVKRETAFARNPWVFEIVEFRESYYPTKYVIYTVRLTFV